ncbi:MAG: Lrp/AsnC ligand binding domain-containing protein [Chloroflexi bacterium]|nr:Lrp/AsnC ligand binding domain-containing protein [Chloroflexota bacterium]
MRAYILIEATIGKARDVAAKMKQVPQVKQCFLVTGPYDVIAVV